VGDPVWWALGVAVASLITSGLTLFWNIAQFRRSGGVLDIKSAWYVGLSESRERLSDLEITFTVRTTNKGRSAITIDTIMAASIPRSTILAATSAGLPDADSLPYRLEPGETRIWQFGLSRLLAELGQEQHSIESVVGVANLGDADLKPRRPRPP
jgi:hypothetical protein